MKTFLRSVTWAGVLALGALGFSANVAHAQAFGFTYSSPGLSLGVGRPAYPVVVPPPVVYAPPPVVYAPPPVIYGGGYYGGRPYPYAYGRPGYYGHPGGYGYRGPGPYYRR